MPDDISSSNPSAQPQWITDLREHGYCVVPGVIPPSACEEFRDSALSWLESWKLGFNRNDVSTWNKDCMPPHNFGGMFRYHGVSHEDFMWKIRLQPGMKDAFAKVYGTDDLVVSFDQMNLTLPVNEKTGRKDIEITEPWPHIDQDPTKLDEPQSIQGVANMGACGPNDGGLVVVKDSPRRHTQYFESVGGYKQNKPQGHSFKDDGSLDWYLEHGCEVVKICGNPGDLFLWDSRTIHWNSSPTGTEPRFVQYIAWNPRSRMSEEDVKQKVEVFRTRTWTGADGAKNPPIPEENQRCDPLTRPVVEPQETPELMRALGVRV